MTPLESLQQIALLLGLMSCLILVAEVGLYWLSAGYRQLFYWPVNICVGGVLGFVGGGSSLTIGLGLAGGAGLSYGFQRLKGQMRLAMMLMLPAFLMVALVVIYPFFFQFKLSMTNLNLYTVNRWLMSGELSWAGVNNYYKVFSQSPLQTATFWVLLLRTFVWTIVNVVSHVAIGLGLALLLNQLSKGRAVYRTLLIVPWAMPQVVAILAWRGEFHPEFGYINQLIQLIGLQGINWWSEPLPVFISCCIVNIWLGVPFMMVVFLGGLQSIPQSYYEAASIDGASAWQKFRHVTLPLLKPVVVPSVTLGTIWTFNNVNVIYLMTGQDGGNEFADILVTALYKSAFTYSRFSYSAAFALVILAILMSVTALWMWLSRGEESVV